MEEVDINYNSADMPEFSSAENSLLENEERLRNMSSNNEKMVTDENAKLIKKKDYKKKMIDQNTQKLLEAYLRKQNKRVRELHFPPLFGEIDLYTIETLGFKNVKALYFYPGNITGFVNFPESIEIFHAPNNLIEEISGLPSNLQILNLNKNKIKEIDLNGLSKLEELYISFNELKMLYGLPRTLLVLHCEFNHISDLDLYGLEKLHTLHCNNNPKLQLIHVPPTVVNGNYKNNFVSVKDIKVEDDYVKMESDYKKKVYEFFNLKNKYEQEKKKILRSAAREQPKNKKINNIAYLKLKKPIQMPPCAGCSGKGGMTFSITASHYSAQCANNPKCDWKIHINRGFFELRENMLYNYHNHIEVMKELFIETKMDSLFRYLTDTQIKAQFERRSKLYELYSTHYKQFLDTHTHIYYNEDKKKLIHEKEKEINTHLEEVKRLLSEENDEDNRAITLESVVRIQHENIKPLMEYIQRLKYENMSTEKDVNSGEVRLFQHEALCDKLDTLLDGSMTFEEEKRILSAEMTEKDAISKSTDTQTQDSESDDRTNELSESITPVTGLQEQEVE